MEFGSEITTGWLAVRTHSLVAGGIWIAPASSYNTVIKIFTGVNWKETLMKRKAMMMRCLKHLGSLQDIVILRAMELHVSCWGLPINWRKAMRG